ncbi:vegetative incompatibility protein 4 [Apiospora arundinis]|uniref:protein-ribulosamine 3-kinase n=1 Tax=Apiospora arundinis TaxID=335852 RepID=A0ABR2J4M6_9PEZI
MATVAVENGPKVVDVPEILVPSHQGNFPLDSAVIEALPQGDTLISAERYGNSAWSSTARLTVKKENGKLHDYFAKIITGELAEARVLGEFNCMLELWRAMPNIVPQPRAHGKCHGMDAACYFVCDYLEIDHRPPDAVKLGAKIAELHRVSKSPTGQFGFHVTPYDGKLPLVADWDPSWVSFYGKLLKGVYQHDISVNGYWKELDDAMELTLNKVIPRLLGPLEEDGRTVKPCLIHGDLWEENIGTELRTGELYIFDSCAYYAHHEMAIGMWRVDHHHMKAKEYRNQYFQNYEPDEPAEECDDRNRLYAIKERIMYSAHVPGSKAREQALEDMLYLIEQYVEEDTPIL